MSGCGRVGIAAIVVLLGIADIAAAKSGVSTTTAVGGFGPAKVRTDGTLTVGGQETLYIKEIPRRPKLKLAASIYPPIVSPGECFQLKLGFCVPEPLFPAPGTPRMRASHKGRAQLTFLTPPGVEFLSFSDPLQSHPVPFTNGEKVEVDVEETFKRRHTTITSSVAQTQAVIEVPPPPPPSP